MSIDPLSTREALKRVEEATNSGEDQILLRIAISSIRTAHSDSTTSPNQLKGRVSNSKDPMISAFFETIGLPYEERQKASDFNNQGLLEESVLEFSNLSKEDQREIEEALLNITSTSHVSENSLNTIRPLISLKKALLKLKGSGISLKSITDAAKDLFTEDMPRYDRGILVEGLSKVAINLSKEDISLKNIALLAKSLCSKESRGREKESLLFSLARTAIFLSKTGIDLEQIITLTTPFIKKQFSELEKGSLIETFADYAERFLKNHLDFEEFIKSIHPLCEVNGAIDVKKALNFIESALLSKSTTITNLELLEASSKNQKLSKLALHLSKGKGIENQLELTRHLEAALDVLKKDKDLNFIVKTAESLFSEETPVDEMGKLILALAHSFIVLSKNSKNLESVITLVKSLISERMSAIEKGNLIYTLAQSTLVLAKTNKPLLFIVKIAKSLLPERPCEGQTANLIHNLSKAALALSRTKKSLSLIIRITKRFFNKDMIGTQQSEFILSLAEVISLLPKGTHLTSIIKVLEPSIKKGSFQNQVHSAVPKFIKFVSNLLKTRVLSDSLSYEETEELESKLIETFTLCLSDPSITFDSATRLIKPLFTKIIPEEKKDAFIKIFAEFLEFLNDHVFDLLLDTEFPTKKEILEELSQALLRTDTTFNSLSMSVDLIEENDSIENRRVLLKILAQIAVTLSKSNIQMESFVKVAKFLLTEGPPILNRELFLKSLAKIELLHPTENLEFILKISIPLFVKGMSAVEKLNLMTTIIESKILLSQSNRSLNSVTKLAKPFFAKEQEEGKRGGLLILELAQASSILAKTNISLKSIIQLTESLFSQRTTNSEIGFLICSLAKTALILSKTDKNLEYIIKHSKGLFEEETPDHHKAYWIDSIARAILPLSKVGITLPSIIRLAKTLFSDDMKLEDKEDLVVSLAKTAVFLGKNGQNLKFIIRFAKPLLTEEMSGGETGNLIYSLAEICSSLPETNETILSLIKLLEAKLLIKFHASSIAAVIKDIIQIQSISNTSKASVESKEEFFLFLFTITLTFKEKNLDIYSILEKLTPLLTRELTEYQNRLLIQASAEAAFSLRENPDSSKFTYFFDLFQFMYTGQIAIENLMILLKMKTEELEQKSESLKNASSNVDNQESIHSIDYELKLMRKTLSILESNVLSEKERQRILQIPQIYPKLSNEQTLSLQQSYFSAKSEKIIKNAVLLIVQNVKENKAADLLDLLFSTLGAERLQIALDQNYSDALDFGKIRSENTYTPFHSRYIEYASIFYSFFSPLLNSILDSKKDTSLIQIDELQGYTLSCLILKPDCNFQATIELKKGEAIIQMTNYRLERETLIFNHSPIESLGQIKASTNEYLQKCLDFSLTQEQLKINVGMLRYFLAQGTFFHRGSAAIAEWIEKALYEYHGYKSSYHYLGDDSPGHPTADLDAFAYLSLKSYIEAYLSKIHLSPLLDTSLSSFFKGRDLKSIPIASLLGELKKYIFLSPLKASDLIPILVDLEDCNCPISYEEAILEFLCTEYFNQIPIPSGIELEALFRSNEFSQFPSVERRLRVLEKSYNQLIQSVDTSSKHDHQEIERATDERIKTMITDLRETLRVNENLKTAKMPHVLPFPYSSVESLYNLLELSSEQEGREGAMFIRTALSQDKTENLLSTLLFSLNKLSGKMQLIDINEFNKKGSFNSIDNYKEHKFAFSSFLKNLLDKNPSFESTGLCTLKSKEFQGCCFSCAISLASSEDIQTAYPDLESTTGVTVSPKALRICLSLEKENKTYPSTEYVVTYQEGAPNIPLILNSTQDLNELKPISKSLFLECLKPGQTENELKSRIGTLIYFLAHTSLNEQGIGLAGNFLENAIYAFHGYSCHHPTPQSPSNGIFLTTLDALIHLNLDTYLDEYLSKIHLTPISSLVTGYT